MKIPAALQIFRIGGRRLAAQLVLSVPIGIIQGVNEVLFGFALLAFLQSVQLVPAGGFPAVLNFLKLKPVLSLFLIAVLRSGLQFISMFVGQLSYESFNSAVRTRAASALELPLSALSVSVAELSNVFSSLLPKSAVLVSSMLQACASLFLLVVTMAAVLRLSVSLALVALVAIAILGLPMFLSRRAFQRFSASVYAETKSFNDRALKDFRNLGFLKIIGRSREEAASLGAISRAILSNFVRFSFWVTASSTFPQIAAVCVIAVVVLAQRNNGTADSAVLVPFVYLLSRITNAGSELTRAVGNIQFHKPYSENLYAFISRIAAATSSADVGGDKKIGDEPVSRLEVSGLSVGRDSDLVSGLSVSAAAGDFLFISGESGRGKTTFLLTLIGLVPPRAGSVAWNGISVADVSRKDLQKRVAFSGPEPFLLDATVRENVLFGNEHLGLSDDKIWEALALAEAGFVKEIPAGLDQRLQEGGEGISAGQKQRLSIARAILRSPEILLLDEATANIDVKTEALIIANIRRRLPRAIIIAVSHRHSVSEFASRSLSF